jgi:hypothetical protein
MRLARSVGEGPTGGPTSCPSEQVTYKNERDGRRWVPEPTAGRRVHTYYVRYRPTGRPVNPSWSPPSCQASNRHQQTLQPPQPSQGTHQESGHSRSTPCPHPCRATSTSRFHPPSSASRYHWCENSHPATASTRGMRRDRASPSSRRLLLAASLNSMQHHQAPGSVVE